MKFTLNDINELKKELSELQEPEKQAISSNEAIKMMIDEITDLQKQGFKLRDIYQLIKKKGFIDISERTFNQYVFAAKREKPKKTKARTKPETTSVPKVSKNNKSTDKAIKSTVSAPKQTDTTKPVADDTLTSRISSSFTLKEDSADI
ncbi:hypothetical protein [Zooshikella harenae]|uniref:MobC n=1 Tax=Zooshikella harenae TaxID=2827238 RepID=A0ABS5ZLU1_9GAMM|nr:hypothetical protein [Zooshikella harenae]MBU2714466.1 hypothetical protein [Zooshikella harenae]